MGKAMKAMKSGVKKKVKNESPEKGHSPGKGPKGILKRPSAKPSLPLPNDPGLSLDEKMEQFNKKTNGNTQEFLDNLTGPQREALWGRFSRARKALKDPKLDSLWDKHCKGEGSDPHKKQLMAIFLKTGPNLQRTTCMPKSCWRSLRPLVSWLFLCALQSLGLFLLATAEAARRHLSGCHLLSPYRGLA